MKHPPKRIPRRQLREQRRNRVTVSHVTSHYRHLGPGIPQLVGQLRNPLSPGPGSTDEHHVGHPVAGHDVVGQRRTGHPGPAGDHDRAPGKPGGAPGNRQHHLADMAGLADEAIRPPGQHHVESLGRQRLQLSGSEHLHQFGQHLRDPVRPGFDQIERTVTGAPVLLGDRPRVANIGFAHFDEAPARAQQPQRRIDKLTGQRVEHHVDSGTADGLAELLLEFQGAGVADMVFVKTQLPQGIPLAATGRGENLQAPAPSQLHRGHTHPAGGGVHQHLLPGPHPRQVRQTVERGQEHHRDTGSRIQRPARRNRGHQPLIRHRLGSRHAQQPHHRVADGHAGNTRPYLDNDPGALDAELAPARIHAQRHQHVAEVHPDRGHRYSYLPGGELASFTRAHLHVVECARASGDQAPPGRDLGQPKRRVGRPQPSLIGHIVARHQLRLTRTDYRADIHRPVRIQQHHPAGMLRLRRTHQPPHRRTGQVRDVLVGQTHRAMGQHHQNAVLVAGQPRLQHRQHRMRGRPYRFHHVRLPRHLGSQLPHRRGWLANTVVCQRYRRPTDLEQAAVSGRNRGQRPVGQRTKRHVPYGQDG
ncbi:hypothetical protein LAUMK13_02465 [Mycobacterium innocens]|uniref:Uncharacterized protein n=1 Tax=Mycobacterium innocens TaxID=2341083 RepID=A0A498Q1L4_9MYCO|nr:hypothetical protein LAUMK13_02465 [Mycobacterium innocens]